MSVLNDLPGNLGVPEDAMRTGAAGLGAGLFVARRAAAVSLASGAVVPYDTDEIDVSGWFDTATARYTPLIPGYYFFCAVVDPNVALTSDALWEVDLYKNGLAHRMLSRGVGRGGVAINAAGSAQAVANGTTDFFEIVVTHTHGSDVGISVGSTARAARFSGHLIGRS